MDDAPRLAELIGALSLATDLAAGFGMETALRTCVLSVEIAKGFGLRDEALRDVYYTGLLRFIGCTAFSHEQAYYGGGDDQAFSRDLARVDAGRPAEVALTIVREVGRSARGLRRFQAVARTLGDPEGPKKFATAHCDLAIRLAVRLGMGEGVVESLGQMYERWDGRGQPLGLSGDAIALPARIMHVAFRAEVHRTLDGVDAACRTIVKRSGGELEPALAELFSAHADEWLSHSGDGSVWERFLSSEPAPLRRVNPAQRLQLAEAFAQFVDIKSPYMLGHSTGVAALARDAGAALGVADADALYLAGLLHDVGRVSVPNGIWDKPRSLNAAEWERVRLHAYYTERIVSRLPGLESVVEIAASHHERLDGRGYHRGVRALPLEARLLAAADVYQALRQERAHRAAYDDAAACELLAAEVCAGRLDARAVDAVLAAAGQRKARPRSNAPADLSEREVEVLRWLARGLSNKQIGAHLFISPKTVQHHIAHIYEKTGVKTRPAAALFAVEHGLLE